MNQHRQLFLCVAVIAVSASSLMARGGVRVRAEGKLQIEGLEDPDTAYDWGGHSIVVDGVHHLWWTRHSQAPGEYDTIWHAASKDGREWQEARKVLVPAETEQEKMHVADPSVVKVGRTFYMFYETNRRVTKEASESQLMLATSPDGVSWTKYPNNRDPQPIIAPKENIDGQYGIGMPSVHYRDQRFFMYYTSSFDGPDMIRLAVTKEPREWGHYRQHEVIAQAAGADVKYNSKLGLYVMAYCTRSDLTPGPSPVTTYEVHTFVSPDGRIWNGHHQPAMWKIATPVTCLTCRRDFHQPRTRSFATLVATDQYGCIHESTMRVIFMEGKMHPVAKDWKTESRTWDLHALKFSLGLPERRRR